MLLKITKTTNLGAIAQYYPKLAEVLQQDYGLHCVGCIANSYDTVEMGAKIHHMTDEEIDEMVERVNEAVNFKE